MSKYVPIHKGCVYSATNVGEDADKKSEEATAAGDDAANTAADSNNSTDTEMTPTKKAARTFSQLESESAAAPVSEPNFTFPCLRVVFPAQG